MEEVKTEEKENKLTSAKNMSKLFKVISVLGIILCHVAKWLGWIQAESGEICLMWAVVYGLGAGTIDFSGFRLNPSEPFCYMTENNSQH